MFTRGSPTVCVVFVLSRRALRLGREAAEHGALTGAVRVGHRVQVAVYVSLGANHGASTRRADKPNGVRGDPQAAHRRLREGGGRGGVSRGSTGAGDWRRAAARGGEELGAQGEAGKNLRLGSWALGWA